MSRDVTSHRVTLRSDIQPKLHFVLFVHNFIWLLQCHCWLY